MKKEIKLNTLDKLTECGYKETENCFYKFPDENDYWVLRVDKNTKTLKYWNFATGQTKDPTPYIQDLIKAGIVE
jgi:hypothetical protein